jgi:hypothetical protein
MVALAIIWFFELLPIIRRSRGGAFQKDVFGDRLG